MGVVDRMRVWKASSPEFVDERGAIARILDDGSTVIRSVLLITSEAGAVRGQHFHKQDSHYSYMVRGRMEYTQWPVDAPDQRETTILGPGDMVFSPPMTVHVMRFVEESTFLALATRSRHQEAYEEDTVRVSEGASSRSSGPNGS